MTTNRPGRNIYIYEMRAEYSQKVLKILVRIYDMRTVSFLQCFLSEAMRTFM